MKRNIRVWSRYVNVKLVAESKCTKMCDSLVALLGSAWGKQWKRSHNRESGSSRLPAKLRKFGLNFWTIFPHLYSLQTYDPMILSWSGWLPAAISKLSKVMRPMIPKKLIIKLIQPMINPPVSREMQHKNLFTVQHMFPSSWSASHSFNTQIEMNELLSLPAGFNWDRWYHLLSPKISNLRKI